MNTLIRLVLSAYQILLSPLIKQVIGVRSSCRYSPSCSEFAKDVIKKQGVLRGGCIAVLRVLSCQPFFSKNTIGVQ